MASPVVTRSREHQEPPRAPTLPGPHPRPDPEEEGDGPHGRGSSSTAATAGENAVKPATACFNCRALRQKCDRKTPCSRCVIRRRPCRYPSGSNRGRKHLNAHYAASVDKLLSGIGETAGRDQVVAALLNFAGAHPSDVSYSEAEAAATSPSPSSSPSPSLPQHHADLSLSGTTTAAQSTAAGIADPQDASAAAHLKSTGRLYASRAASVVPPPDPELAASLVSPLHIMAAAITDAAPYYRGHHSGASAAVRGTVPRKDLVDDRLSRYFSTQPIRQQDWQVLASQPIDSPLKLETSMCDPVAARLIDLGDVAWYFRLFFKYRSPLIGLLDQSLHTPEYVRLSSFVLFSVVCTLGCAVSDRPRDRMVYPALLSLAEANMKWAIAVCVKSLETIQAILIMQYWAPLSQRQSDDPYWLRVSHAVQLARELGIHRPAAIAEHVNNWAPGAAPELKERLTRNFERTWLFTFISDKSFGITTGRAISIPLKELPVAAFEWWRKPMTTPFDRIVCGIVEARALLLNAMERRKRAQNTLASVAQWHAHSYQILDQTRNARCIHDGQPSTQYISVLAFYMDHSIMVLNAQALRDLTAIDPSGTSPELLGLSVRTVDVACRLLDTMLYDDALLELMVGSQNNQLIMFCHAATEILYAIQRGGLSPPKVEDAAAKVRAIPSHLDRIAAMLPTTSAVHLYASLSRFLVSQLDKVVRRTEAPDDPDERTDNSSDLDSLLADWWRTVDNGTLDSWMEMSFLGGAEQQQQQQQQQQPPVPTSGGDQVFS